jgi:NAD(P)H-quinone oxidoreductase subunit 4
MASLALPGMSGFVAELVVFFGLITSPKFMLMAIGMILTPIYLLSMLVVLRSKMQKPCHRSCRW